MRVRLLLLVAVVGLVAAHATPAAADITNNALIKAHVDALFAGIDPARVTPAQREALFAKRLPLSLGALVPVLGSYLVDRKVYGGIRPAAVIFDWIIGGLVPAVLGVVALASDGALSTRTRTILGVTALGIYGATRIGVLITANLHISDYNRFVRARLAGQARPALAPGVIATASW